MSTLIVTIDGGNGVGKTSLIAALKQRYAARGYNVLEISGGALYRTLGWLTYVNAGESVEAAAATPTRTILHLADMAHVQLDGATVNVNGAPIDRRLLKSHEMTELIPRLAARPELRAYVDGHIRAAAAACNGLVVAEGRDMGTTVFPEAAAKVYLTVDPAEAARRQHEPVERVLQRDQRDRERAHGPLRCPEGATVIDTTHIQPAEKAAAVAAVIETAYPELALLQ